MPFPHDNPALIDQLVKIYDDAAARIKQAVLHPPGKSDRAQMYNQARAAQLMNQVKAEIDRLKGQAAKWTSNALQTAVKKGITVADQQIAEIFPNADHVPHILQGHVDLKINPGGFSQIDHDVVRVLAQDSLAHDTIGDLVKAANSMQNTTFSALRRMSATGVTNEQVNQILAGRHVIEGQPAQAVRALRDELEIIHGKQVTIVGPSGQPRTYDTSYYASMVATTKTREAVVKGTNARLVDHGITLVKIVGRFSVHFCTNYLNHVYSLDGQSEKYPALSSLPQGGPPFHPNCSKSTTPYIEGLSHITARGEDTPAAAA